MSVNSKSKFLPRAQEVDAGILESVFQSTATSYKFLLAKSILDILRQKNRKFEDDCVMQFSEIRIEMLVNAWFPAMYFKLKFGKQDFIGRSLFTYNDTLFKDIRISKTTEARALFRKYEKQLVRIQKISKQSDPTRYAIYRFLRPWFRDYLLNKRDPVVNGIVAKKSRELFHSTKPLYQIRDDKDNLQLHPYWVEYLWANMGIVEGWLDMQWLKYLQRKNPHVPSLSAKLWALPDRREPLKRQRDYWQPLVDKGFRCIYTDELVSRKHFDLDHFLPWSWVGHDQLWNLVPVSSRVNSSKGRKLPKKSDIPKLSEAHFQIIKYTFENEDNPSNKLEDYTLGLNLDLNSQSLEKSQIDKAYRNILQPQLRMASNRGFSSWIKR